MNTNPYISIIIPAHNEESFLLKTITAIQKSALKISEKIEIIVILNRCTDSTEKIALEHNCRVIKNDFKNLSKIRNHGINAAKGEVIVTIDADSLMSENMLQKIVEVFKDGRYIGGGVNIIPDRLSLGIILSILLLTPFLIFWGISVGVFYVKKRDLEAIGGFNENIYSAEDLDLARRLKKYGKKQGKKYKHLLSAYIITSARKFDRFGDWYAFKNPLKIWKLLKGKKSPEADKIWYDFNN